MKVHELLMQSISEGNEQSLEVARDLLTIHLTDKCGLLKAHKAVNTAIRESFEAVRQGNQAAISIVTKCLADVRLIDLNADHALHIAQIIRETPFEVAAENYIVGMESDH